MTNGSVAISFTIGSFTPNYLCLAGNVRAKAQTVRRDGKDVEIIEAHLFDMATSVRSILHTLARHLYTSTCALLFEGTEYGT